MKPREYIGEKKKSFINQVQTDCLTLAAREERSAMTFLFHVSARPRGSIEMQTALSIWVEIVAGGGGRTLTLPKPKANVNGTHSIMLETHG